MTAHKAPSQLRARREQGLTLIELLVAIIIGVVVSLAVFSVLSASEGRKRTTTSVNDINQSGNYALYSIERWIRSAGSSFAQGVAFPMGRVFYPIGCVVYAAKGGTQVLPRTSALPAPLSAIALTNYSLAPVLIYPDATTPAISGAKSDAIIVMGANSGGMQSGSTLTGTVTSSSLGVANGVDYAQDDLILVASKNSANSCSVQQVGAGVTVSTTQLPLAGTYAAGAIGSYSITAIDKDVSGIFNLGNIAAGAMPAFQVFAVGDSNTLYAYDLLQGSASPLSPVSGDVFEMHALYGVDNDDDGVLDTWVSPKDATGTYAWSKLTDGSEAAIKLIFRIKAIRVGMILRTSLIEKTTVAPASLKLFDGSALVYTRNLSADERLYRYRVVDATIPIRNTLGSMN